MLSIIICSINAEKLATIKQNIEETIDPGIDYEVIGIDNSKEKSPIAAVYNQGAQQAKYPYLLFTHEDVFFKEKGWFAKIEQKLREETCGVVGFAGCKVKVNVPSGWFTDKRWNVAHYIQNSKDGIIHKNIADGKEFEEVAVLDGFALFVRRNVWEKFPFDEKLLKGFHCYDIDFSLQIGTKYKNYVCASTVVEHFSSGNFGNSWLSTTIMMHEKKWHKFLPAISSDITLTQKELKRLEEKAYFRLLRYTKHLPGYDHKQYLHSFLKYPMTGKHLGHLLK